MEPSIISWQRLSRSNNNANHLFIFLTHLEAESRMSAVSGSQHSAAFKVQTSLAPPERSSQGRKAAITIGLQLTDGIGKKGKTKA